MTDLAQLRLVLSNLIDEADAPPGIATAINLACAGFGLFVWRAADGLLGLGGLAFAILCLGAIAKWVVQR